MLSPGEYIDHFVLREGYYEEEVLNALMENLKEGDVFWDIGANIGLHGLSVAKLRPDVRVFAFEPNPAMAQLIRSAAQKNDVSVEVQEIALDQQNGEASFFMHRGNAGRSSLHNWESDPSLEQIRVRTARGASLVAENIVPPPNVLKLDVEGNEHFTLLGMVELLESPELHTVVFEDAKTAATPSKSLLQEMGFCITGLVRMENTHHNLDNYVARKKAAPRKAMRHGKKDLGKCTTLLTR